MIRTRGLTKRYNGTTAVKDLNLDVERGEIYGFLGPNGAGKTTTILMLVDIVKPTRGQILLFGEEMTRKNYFDVKSRIGVVSENQYLYGDMTAYEYLDFFARLYQVEDKAKRIVELLEAVDLYQWRHARLNEFSRGMQQKVGFVRALLHDPQLLIADEPAAGLDPMGIREVRALLERQREKGKTVFLSSHVLSEIERVADRVGIINKGELVAEGDMQNLRRRLSSEVELEIELFEFKQEILDALQALTFVKDAAAVGRRLAIKTDAVRDYRPQISGAIFSHGGVILDMKTKEMSLEDAFVTITEQNVSLLTRQKSGREE